MARGEFVLALRNITVALGKSKEGRGKPRREREGDGHNYNVWFGSLFRDPLRGVVG